MAANDAEAAVEETATLAVEDHRLVDRPEEALAAPLEVETIRSIRETVAAQGRKDVDLRRAVELEVMTDQEGTT